MFLPNGDVAQLEHMFQSVDKLDVRHRLERARLDRRLYQCELFPADEICVYTGHECGVLHGYSFPGLGVPG